MTLIFIGKITTDMFIDYLRLEPLSVEKIIGGILIIDELNYYIKCDKSLQKSKGQQIMD